MRQVELCPGTIEYENRGKLVPKTPMSHLAHRRDALSFLVLLVVFGPATAALAQDIPLEHCDVLPMIEVKVAGQARSFLVDTAATSMLNLESLDEGSSRDLRVTSWSGTQAASAKEVTIEGLKVGRTKVVRITLPAIDLSAIGKACGRKIDGILGADLLIKIGATVDLKRQTLNVTTADEVRDAHLASEMQRETERCTKAFNESDEKTFGDCLDPKIELFTTREALYGRDKVASYICGRYFHQSRLNIRKSGFHTIGEAVWYEYEFTIEMETGTLSARGMAMCKKADGHWRMVSSEHHGANMLIVHVGRYPEVDASAWIAPDATVCGDVVIGPGSRVMHGSRVIGENGGSIKIGRECIIMENSVVRATQRHPCTIGDHCLIGPNAHVVGAVLEDQVFIATGAAIFHGAHLAKESQVRVHAIVHLRTKLERGAIVPIGWVAAGDPARILPPDQHDEIWAVIKPLNFPQWVYGFERSTPELMVHITHSLSDLLGTHARDTSVES